MSPGFFEKINACQISSDSAKHLPFVLSKLYSVTREGKHLIEGKTFHAKKFFNFFRAMIGRLSTNVVRKQSLLDEEIHVAEKIFEVRIVL